ncbi:MAG: hypothetical protein Q8M54_11380 [Desulfobaccales bacterium]|nr:hypothetical protein [Desulfobaccales bacterium]
MSVLWTGYSYYFPYRMGHDQICLGTMIAKDLDPGLYPRDYAFKDNSLYRHYIPFFRQIMRSLTTLTGSFETALFSLVPVVVLVYVLGMALLLFRVSNSLWAALLITFFSIPYRPAPGGEIWGVGGLEFMLARTLATALTPYLFILFFNLLESPNLRKGAFLGALTGLLAFLHPPTALFTGEIFVVLFTLTCLAKPRHWPVLGALLLVYTLTAVYPLTLMEQPLTAAAGAPVNFGELSQVVQQILKIPTDWGISTGAVTARRVWLLLGATLLLGLNYLLRPALQKPRAALIAWLWGGLLVLYLGWRIAGKGAGLSLLYALAALYLILRYRQKDPQPLDWWLLGLGFVTLMISLVPLYGLTLLWLKLEFLPLTTLVVEHYRAVRFLHLFLYLLSARAAVYLVAQLSEWLKTSPQAVMTEYTLLALSIWNWGLFWVILSGVTLYEALRRFSPARRLALAGSLAFGLLGLAGLLFYPSSLKMLWQGLNARGLAIRTPADLKADEPLFAWALSHTPRDALFYHNSAAFRYRGQRSITHSQADLINYRDHRFVDFYRRYQEFEKSYATPQSLARKAQEVDFIVVEKSRPVRLRFPLAFENDKYLVYQTSKRCPDPPAPGNIEP